MTLTQKWGLFGEPRMRVFGPGAAVQPEKSKFTSAGVPFDPLSDVYPISAIRCFAAVISW